MNILPCVLPFLLLAAFLWTMAWLLVRKARRGRPDAKFQQGLQDLLELEGERAPQVGRRSSPWTWVFAAIIALLAFAVTFCCGAVLLDARGGY